ncbi:hypothetical protein ACIQNK_33755 [Streptomyces sp. NPDC091273]|uniref:hypothetical protein n=1 Tax=Streptomyces sp. NPDC091273 TaxID=3365982 RepID=UPI0037FA7692
MMGINGHPVVLVNRPAGPDDFVSGSGRAPRWFDIITSLEQHDGLSAIGHQQACGVRVAKAEKLGDLGRLFRILSAGPAASGAVHGKAEGCSVYWTYSGAPTTWGSLRTESGGSGAVPGVAGPARSGRDGLAAVLQETTQVALLAVSADGPKGDLVLGPDADCDAGLEDLQPLFELVRRTVGLKPFGTASPRRSSRSRSSPWACAWTGSDPNRTTCAWSPGPACLACPACGGTSLRRSST